MTSQEQREPGTSVVELNDVEDLQQTAENLQMASHQNLGVLGISGNHEVARVETDNAHFGDTNINTTGPVFNAPVTMAKHISQNITHHTTQHINVQQAAATQEPELETEVRHKCEELKSALKKKVKSIANEESSLADFSQRPITPVNLSMVSEPQRIDDEFQAEGHFHRREDFAKMYDRPTGDITPEQLFDRSKQQAEEKAEQIFEEDQAESKQEYVEKHGNAVGVTGNAGIGKTTFLKKTALQSLGGHAYGNISFFFYIVVRFINFKTSMTFLQFLLHTMLPGWNCNLLVANEILKVLSSDPNVVVFVDGLDEAAFKSFSTEAPIPLLEGKNKPEVYLKNLAGGKLLPRARKIFTSRPAPFYKLHPSHRPQFVVQILGLTPNSQKELGQQLCGERYRSMEERLEQNTNLFAYCYVPVNFILTVHYLMSYDGDIQFASLSRVLAFTCVQYSQTGHLKDHHRMLDKLAKMAWNGFRDKKIVFNSKDFKNVKIKDSTADAFLNTSVTKRGNLKLTILDGHKQRYFSHLIWQEFFAAVYLMMIMPSKEFEEHYIKLSNDRWEVVAKFAFGICDRSVFDELETVISKSSPEVLNYKTLLLNGLTSSCAMNPSRENVLRCCSWAHEAKHNEITSSVSSSLPRVMDFHKTLRESTLLPTDIENLSYAIERRTEPLKSIQFWGNQIGDRGAASVANCIHNTEEVDLGENDLTSFGVEHLSKKIKELKTPLKKLNLFGNKIGDQGAVSMGNCIHNIEELNLGECDLTSSGAEYLFEKIKALKAPMKFLDLSWNKHLTDACTESLAACVHNILELLALNCNFTQAGKDLVRSKSKGKVQI